MEAPEFIDHYEILEISPNADSATIERMFRHFARHYHPDNPQTGDRLHFDLVVEAHVALKDPVKRAQYDVQYKKHSNLRWKLVEEASDGKGIERDVVVQNKLLSVLYVKRRQNVSNPGFSDGELALLLDCPVEHLEFHVWYLREKGWIARTESGSLAITADGVDRANSQHHHKATNKLLTDQSSDAD